MITCTFEDGGSAKLRHVTVNAIVMKDEKVLLGKRGEFRGKPLLESGKWGLIGGFLDRDESTTEALRREVREETGVEIDQFQLLHVKDNPDRPHEDRQNVEFVYIVEAKTDMTEKKNEEITQKQWFPLDQLPADTDIAFDHGDDLKLYKKYLAEKFPLPIIGKI